MSNSVNRIIVFLFFITAAASATAQSTEIIPLPSITGPIPETENSQAFRSAGGDETELLAKYNYQRREFFIEGETSLGKYKTRLLVAVPKEEKDFTGIVLTETFQTSVWLQVREYLMREGHGWVMISSRGNRWLTLLQRGRDRYQDLVIPNDEMNPEILAQAVKLLRNDDTAKRLLDSKPAQTVILSGFSGDGAGVRMYIDKHHDSAKFANGKPIFDAYFVSGTAVGSAPKPIADIDIPVMELMNENEMIRSFDRGAMSLSYRRPDGPNFRLYEIAGAGHIATRGRPDDAPLTAGCLERPLSQLPMNHIYSNAMHRLITWVVEGEQPPRAQAVAYQADGRTIVKDDHGNTVGGVRNSYLDVPLASINTISTQKPDAERTTRCEMIAHAKPFSAEKIRQLYGSKENYVTEVRTRMNELVEQRWYLPQDAAEIIAEAQEFSFPQVSE